MSLGQLGQHFSFFLILKGPAGPEETPTPITVQPIFYNTYCKPNGIFLARKPPETPGNPRKPFKKMAGNPARVSIFCVAKSMVRYNSLSFRVVKIRADRHVQRRWSIPSCLQAAAGRWAGGPVSRYGLCRGDGHASAGPEQDRKLLPCGPVAKEYRMNLESQRTQKW